MTDGTQKSSMMTSKKQIINNFRNAFIDNLVTKEEDLHKYQKNDVLETASESWSLSL